MCCLSWPGPSCKFNLVFNSWLNKGLMKKKGSFIIKIYDNMFSMLLLCSESCLLLICEHINSDVISFLHNGFTKTYIKYKKLIVANFVNMFIVCIFIKMLL